MSPEDQLRVSKEIEKITHRLIYLRDQPFQARIAWPIINDRLHKAHNLFQESISFILKPWKSYQVNLQNDLRTFEQWQRYLEDAWKNIHLLRNFHNSLFRNDYNSMIYHHIFIEELLRCFPKGVQGSDTSFLLSPAGALTYERIDDRLFDNLWCYWFDDTYEAAFNKILDECSIIYFECHHEHNFIRHSILIHEIFHNIVRYNKSISERLNLLLNLDWVKTLFDEQQTERKSHIEELFCDFASAWFYGPIYLQSFAEEMSHYSILTKKTHPPTDLRAKLLIVANKHCENHLGYKLLVDFLGSRGRPLADLPKDQTLKKLAKEFDSALREIKLQPYKYNEPSSLEQMNRITSFFKSNIPIVVQDIRDLINNLPREVIIDGQKLTHNDDIYSNLISESLRKSNVLQQVIKHFRNPEHLFDAPEFIETIE